PVRTGVQKALAVGKTRPATRSRTGTQSWRGRGEGRRQTACRSLPLSQPGRRQGAQLVVDQGQELLGARGVALVDGTQVLGGLYPPAPADASSPGGECRSPAAGALPPPGRGAAEGVGTPPAAPHPSGGVPGLALAS